MVTSQVVNILFFYYFILVSILDTFIQPYSIFFFISYDSSYLMFDIEKIKVENTHVLAFK